MKKYIIIATFILATPIMAANTSGYAWNGSVGWFDFGKANVTDSAVTGNAYNDKTGWLTLDGVKNTGGTLSGYAWSESVGWFDFSKVTIQNGQFRGYAYDDNIGFLSFDTGTNVTTTWTPSNGSYSPLPSITQNDNTNTSNRPDNNDTNYNSSGVNTNPSVNAAMKSVTQDLKNGMTSSDVKTLQQFLNSQGFTLGASGAGSPGLETNYFGNLTTQSLARFQAAHNITPPAGYFGPLTRAFISTL